MTFWYVRIDNRFVLGGKCYFGVYNQKPNLKCFKFLRKTLLLHILDFTFQSCYQKKKIILDLKTVHKNFGL